MTELEDEIIRKYQSVPLNTHGFDLARVNEGRRVEVIHPQTVSDLKTAVKKGKLWIVPKSEIHLPLPLQPEPPAQQRIFAPAPQILTAQPLQPEPPAQQRISAPAPQILTAQDQSDDYFAAIPPFRRRGRRRGTRRAAVRCSNTVAEYAATVHRRIPEYSSSTQTATSVNDDCIEVLDSEDEELQQVLDASAMEVYEPLQSHSNSKPLPEVLAEYQARVNLFDKQEVIISRRNVLKSVYRALRRPSFDATCKLYVKFSGEMGMDHGGPRRELFRLAINELMTSSIFEGPEEGRLFSHSLQNLDSKEYQLAGRLVGLSLAQDGPGICLNTELLKLMTGRADISFNLDLIPDEDVRIILKQLQDVHNNDTMDSFLSTHSDWMLQQGYTNTWRLRYQDADQAVASLIKQFLFYRTSAEISQFTAGLNEVCGLWDMVLRNPSPWCAVLC